MKKIKQFITAIFLLICMEETAAQDPSFSQFFSSPLNINPALTGNINADWRAIANFRDQWIGPSSPYATGTVSYDRKIFQNKIPNVDDEGNIFGIGGMFMFDRAMGGIVKSSYASLNLSYNIKLLDGDFKHRLAAGFGATYGYRSVDFSGLNFEEQFTGSGFNTNMPTGEAALASMKAYISLNAGCTYSISGETSNFDIGVAAFHLNKPKQTFLKDDNQILAIRKVAHANFETFLSEQLVLSTNAIYQSQDKASYYSVGSALGYYLPTEKNMMLTGGVWYWSKNAIVPYLGLSFDDYQFGLSYDITHSKLSQTSLPHSTWELSFIIRGKTKPSGVIPCPWK
jgi:type IX secretion system PorP/SprF family membrane protein